MLFRSFGTFAATGYYHFDRESMFDGALAEHLNPTLHKGDNYRYFDDSELPWVGRTVFTGDIPTNYRPEVAATISGYVAVQLGKQIYKHSGKVLACHIDSVITEGVVIDDPAWAVKATGEFRGYGVGNYVIGDHVATAGYGGEDTDTWFSSITDRTRIWNDDGTSVPPKVDNGSYLFNRGWWDTPHTREG